MNKPEVSLIMPGIRPHNWVRSYESILGATKRSFELIIISPYPLPSELQNLSNVKYVKDYGSPMRASQIGAMLMEGNIIYPTLSDDAIVIKDSIDNNINDLLAMGDDYKNVIICKYSESKDLEAPERYQNDSYYKIAGMPVGQDVKSKDFWIFNSIFMYRKFFDELGGWDCTYQACPMGHTDFAIRAQVAGAKCKMSNYPIAQLEWMEGTTGDHAPIHNAQSYEDMPYFMHYYHRPLDMSRTKIDLMNWKNAESIWHHRFVQSKA